MKTAAWFVLAVLALASVITITACGGGGSSSVSASSPIMVSVSASSNSVQAGGSDSFTATELNDASGRGVTWTVSCSAPQCGTVSPTATPSGTATTYFAPTTPPASDITITVKATSVADGSKSGSASITFSAITVSVSQTTAIVQAGQTLLISGSANNDPSGQGVSWSISPTSGAGSLSNANSNDVTYNAPATPPVSDLTLTVTATSVADPTKSASVTITVPSLTVSVTAPASTVIAGGTVPNIVAIVGHDPSNKGVTWNVSCSPGPCGNVSPTATPSGVATTYSAPATPPSADLPVTITAVSVAKPIVSASVVITVLAISVSVTAPPNTTNVPAGGTVPNIVATVNNDPSHQGVTWAILPCGVAQCGSLSANASLSGAPITYTAPPTPPASDLGVTVVATSVSDTAQTGAIAITVLAITISISPPSARIPVNATTALNKTPFTATVSNDASNQGATWTLAQGTTACSAAVCGTVTPPVTTGCTPTCIPTVYAAPATVPASASVTLTATSAADPTKLASVTITLTAGTVKIIPANLNFGTLNLKFGVKNRILPTTLTNTGSSALSITSKTIAGLTANAFTVVSDLCGATVASGSSCDIRVKFAPGTAGHYSANLTISDNDISSPQLVLLSGTACSGTRCFGQADIQSALVHNAMSAVPSPTGPNKVGTRGIDLVDATRSDPYHPTGGRRELVVRFWYPTALTRGCKPAPYASASVWNYLAQLEHVPAPQVKTNSCQDAAITLGTHPVVVFTHGYTGTFTDYTFLFEDLASRGYVVASVGHTYETTAVEFSDGRLAKSVLGSHIGDTWRINRQSTSLAVAVRLSDLKFVMDELERLNVSNASPFAGKLDLSRVALAGHSLGGLTALLGVEFDSRFRAGISIDGMVPGPLFSPTDKPIMMLFARGDYWDSDTCHLWRDLRGPRLAVNLKGAEHLTPSDAVWLANGAIKTGTVGMTRTVASVRDYIAGFLDANLNGKPMDDRLLVGLSSIYPDVEVTTQASCGAAQENTQK
jgi:dienelactone hydrolase